MVQPDEAEFEPLAVAAAVVFDTHSCCTPDSCSILAHFVGHCRNEW